MSCEQSPNPKTTCIEQVATTVAVSAPQVSIIKSDPYHVATNGVIETIPGKINHVPEKIMTHGFIVQTDGTDFGQVLLSGVSIDPKSFESSDKCQTIIGQLSTAVPPGTPLQPLPVTSAVLVGVSRPAITGNHQTFQTLPIVTAEKHEQPQTIAVATQQPIAPATATTTNINVSNDKRPFVCDVCSKRFARKSDVTRHRFIHTGERPYPCEQCGKRFVDRSHLKSHRRVHTGERPYACDVCGKRFTRHSDVTRHQLIHFSRQPLACTHCGKAFVDKRSFIRHQLLHSGAACDSGTMSSKPSGRNARVQPHPPPPPPQQQPQTQPHAHQSHPPPLSQSQQQPTATALTPQPQAQPQHQPQTQTVQAPTVLQIAQPVQIANTNANVAGDSMCTACCGTGRYILPLGMTMTCVPPAKVLFCGQCGRSLSKQMDNCGTLSAGQQDAQTSQDAHGCQACCQRIGCCPPPAKEPPPPPAQRIVHQPLERPFACDLCEKAFTSRNDLVIHKRVHAS